MSIATVEHTVPSEVAIHARLLSNEPGRMPLGMARYILALGFSDADKSKMHDLAVRNQQDALTPLEKEELFAYAKAGTLLSILKSKARRTLRGKSKKRAATA
jgi:hypothetical protein